ncbi:HAD family hydrolase [Nocardioides zeicaulis]|uniref:HAD family hydrolase n=1 Tax=Nocardioides zeicaulis TaxID=1776857 RepID=A0ABV6E2V2_9ACTN
MSSPTSESTPQRELPVVVLDLDGTLVDSVYHHVVAWQCAFRDVGRPVGALRIHEAIGMGGDRLVAHVAGASAEAAVGDDVRALHDKHFRAALRSIYALDGAAELVTAIADRGHRVALSSSSEADLVDDLLELVDSRGRIGTVITGSDDVASKPGPESVQEAVRRAGGGTAIVVGDAVWDALAAEAAGARCIGLRSGGVGAERLTSAGASWVFDDPRDLVARIDQSPLRG